MNRKLRKGQLIIHPQQGVFKLQGIKKRKVGDQEKVYLVLIPLLKSRSGLKIFIPQEIRERIGIRKVANKKTILRGLGQATRFLKNNPNKEIEESMELLEDWLREGNFERGFVLLGQLFFKLKILKKATLTARELYKKDLRLLSEELAVAKRCSKAYAQKEILNKLEQVLEKRDLDKDH